VTTANGAPPVRGRTWTAAEYARRNAARATLGLGLGAYPPRRHNEVRDGPFSCHTLGQDQHYGHKSEQAQSTLQ
jgi:hypothetical protein